MQDLENVSGRTTSHLDYVRPHEPVLTPAPEPAPDRIYSTSIRQVDHGYLVEVGCKTFAIENSTKLISLLSAYLLQPGATQKLYEQGKLF